MINWLKQNLLASLLLAFIIWVIPFLVAAFKPDFIIHALHGVTRADLNDIMLVNVEDGRVLAAQPPQAGSQLTVAQVANNANGADRKQEWRVYFP